MKLEDVRDAFAHSPGDEFRHPEKPGVWEVVQRFVDVDNTGGPSLRRSYRLMCTAEGEHHCESKRATEGEVYTTWNKLDDGE